MSKKKGKASTQIALDHDFNVPDTKPDVLHLIQDKAEIKIVETNITQGHVFVKGVLCFQLLYQGDGELPKPHCILGELPFQETIALDEIAPQDKIKVQWQMEDLTSVLSTMSLTVFLIEIMNQMVSEAYSQSQIVVGI